MHPLAHPSAIAPGTPAPSESKPANEAVTPTVITKMYGDYRPVFFAGDFDHPCFHDPEWLKDNGFL